MFYNFAVVVTAGSTEANPTVETLKLTKGIIHRVEVEFPRGCKGYVSLKLYHQEHQVWPSNPPGAFKTDAYTVPIDEHYKLDSAPYSLKARGWAPSATYDHTITVRIGILSEEVLSPLTGLGAMFKKFFKLIGIGG